MNESWGIPNPKSLLYSFVPDRIPVDIIPMMHVILIVTNHMLPESSLPNSALPSFPTAFGPLTSRTEPA